ncbi:MAG: retropepsin-like aspartic protease [Balneolaceae bacterium]
MRVFFKGFLFILFITSLSCNYVKNIKLLTGGKLDRQNFIETIPFTYSKGIIVIEGKVNEDTTKRAFIFDTGAFNSKIEKELSDSLGLRKIAEKDNSTAQGIERKIEVTKINSLKLGNTVFRNIGAGKLEYDKTSLSPCLAKHGLIGANLIKLAHWKINYKSRELSFSDEPFTPDKDKKSILINFDKPLLSGTPSIDIKIGNREVGNVLFDLGFNGGVVLPKNVSSYFYSDKETVILDQSTSGIYGSNIDTLIVKELEIGLSGFSTKVPVEFSSIGKALIGNDFLEHFTVFIDYKKKKITLQQESDVKIEETADFIPGILSDNFWIVNRIEYESELMLGDTLSSINGKKPSDLYSSKCEYFFGITDFLSAGPIEVEPLKGENKTIN